MIHQARKVSSTGLQLVGGLLLVSAAAFAEPDSQKNAVALTERVAGDRIVVVHTDDEVGTAGFAAVKSCTREKIAMSEEKPLDGVHSVLLVMKYDSAGKIVGVHYGEKSVCDFLKQAPVKTAS